MDIEHIHTSHISSTISYFRLEDDIGAEEAEEDDDGDDDDEEEEEDDDDKSDEDERDSTSQCFTRRL